MQLCAMKTKLNLLIALCLSFGGGAQNQKTMKNKIDSTTQGQVIKKGKLVYSEIIINASPEKVWQEFTNFENYSKVPNLPLKLEICIIM